MQNDKATLDFLNQLGSQDRGDDLLLNDTAKKMVEAAGFLISEAQSNLNRSGSIATGDLESSMSIENIDVTGSRLSLDIVLLDRYKFTDLGVKGTEGGKGKYQFKTPYPNKKMADSIKKWMRVRGRRSTKYKAISTTERKDKKINKIRTTADSLTGASYAIATNIKKKGIKPTYFFTKAVKSTERSYKQLLAQGMKLDIINSLK